MASSGTLSHQVWRKSFSFFRVVWRDVQTNTDKGDWPENINLFPYKIRKWGLKQYSMRGALRKVLSRQNDRFEHRSGAHCITSEQGTPPPPPILPRIRNAITWWSKKHKMTWPARGWVRPHLLTRIYDPGAHLTPCPRNSSAGCHSPLVNTR